MQVGGLNRRLKEAQIMRSDILRIVAANNEVKELPLDRALVLQAEVGATYSVVDPETYNVVEGVKVERVGEALAVKVDGKVVATIDNFYVSGQEGTFEAPTLGDPGMLEIAAGTEMIGEVGAPIWEHVAASAAGAGAGAGAGGLQPGRACLREVLFS